MITIECSNGVAVLLPSFSEYMCIRDPGIEFSQSSRNAAMGIVGAWLRMTSKAAALLYTTAAVAAFMPLAVTRSTRRSPESSMILETTPSWRAAMAAPSALRPSWSAMASPSRVSDRDCRPR